MIVLPTFRTDATHELCLKIAKKSKGVCFLGFSRGKDSLCAWLNCKRYFKKVIPFHCASYPGMKHVKETLDYYEQIMETRILRLVGEDYPMSLQRMMYQNPDYLELARQMNVEDYSKLDILEYLRYMYNLPRAWCAFGIAASDSIDRRIYCKKTGGQNPQNLTFYPCWDWPRQEILSAVRKSGAKLSGEYRWSNRTLGGVPSATCNKIYKEHYPEDWNRILQLYPLAEAKTLRERYLDRAWEERRAAGIVSSDDDGDFGDDGTDVMAELGMEVGDVEPEE